MQDISGQVVVVTGGSKGLGRSIVNSLAKDGCRVVAVSRSGRDLENLVAWHLERRQNVTGVVADISSEASVNELFKEVGQQFGHVDILINNAGIARFSSVENLSMELYNQMVDTNLKGTFLSTRAVVPLMKERKSGHIVMISSAAGVRGQPQQSIYSATKFAQVGFAQSLDQELREYGVRVSVINPGSIDTPLWTDVSTNEDEKRKWIEWGKSAMNPDDVAEAVRLVLKQDPNTRILQMLMRPMTEPFE